MRVVLRSPPTAGAGAGGAAGNLGAGFVVQKLCLRNATQVALASNFLVDAFMVGESSLSVAERKEMSWDLCREYARKGESNNIRSALFACYSSDSATEMLGVAEAVEEGKSAMIQNLVTKSTHRRMGLGSLLLHACFQEVKEWGWANVKVNVEDDNAGAFRFYESNGFTSLGDSSFGSRMMIFNFL